MLKAPERHNKETESVRDLKTGRRNSDWNINKIVNENLMLSII